MTTTFRTTIVTLAAAGALGAQEVPRGSDVIEADRISLWDFGGAGSREADSILGSGLGPPVPEPPDLGEIPHVPPEAILHDGNIPPVAPIAPDEPVQKRSPDPVEHLEQVDRFIEWLLRGLLPEN